MNKCKYFLFLLGCVLSNFSITFLKAEEKPTPGIRFACNDQDMPCQSPEIALKNFSTFTFISIAPSLSEKAQSLIVNELKKHGRATKLQLNIKTNKEQGIDLSSLNSGATLIYEIREVSSIDGKELPFIRASLNMRTNVTIKKTAQEYSPYIWSQSCFMQGDLQKDTEKFISNSFSLLMQQFMSDYTSINSIKPEFNFYVP